MDQQNLPKVMTHNHLYFQMHLLNLLFNHSDWWKYRMWRATDQTGTMRRHFTFLHFSLWICFSSSTFLGILVRTAFFSPHANFFSIESLETQIAFLLDHPVVDLLYVSPNSQMTDCCCGILFQSHFIDWNTSNYLRGNHFLTECFFLGVVKNKSYYLFLLSVLLTKLWLWLC